MNDEYRGLADDPIQRGLHLRNPELDIRCEDPSARFQAAVIQLLPILALSAIPLVFFHLGFAIFPVILSPILTGIGYFWAKGQSSFVEAAARQAFFFQMGVAAMFVACTGGAILISFAIALLVCLSQVLGALASIVAIVGLVTTILFAYFIMPLLAASRCFKGYLFSYPISGRWALEKGEINIEDARDEAPPPLL